MMEVQQAAAVAAVLTLLGVALWFLRKRGLIGALPGKRRTARRLECLERLPLGPHHTLHLIQMGETSLLVASSPAGCSLVHSASRQMAAEWNAEVAQCAR